MNKILYKSVIVCPAIWGAILLVSVDAVLATDNPSLITTDSKATTQEPLEPTVAEVKVPTQVAVDQTQLTLDHSAPETLAPVSVTPAADTTVAQVTPATPTTTDLLDQVNQYSNGNSSGSLDQVTNVSQLSDVSPGDWAYEALRSLVERYGCIAGYPDGTFRGNRATTRYEFAAGLNACLQQVERLIASSTEGFVTREDLETLQRLVQEFETELATLGTRVDNLEGRVGFLEDHQFSTTTKLAGEAIFALTDEFNQSSENNTVFQDRVRLTLNTSFSGDDRLVTRLAAGNANAFNSSIGDPFIREGQQTFNIRSTGDNDVVLDLLAYYFNFLGSSKVYLAATGGQHDDYAPTLNPYFQDDDGGNGALSTFASESPIYRIGGGAGGAVSLGTGPLESILGPSTITVGYLAGAGNDAFLGGNLGANSPQDKAGLFDGDYSALAQLNFNLGDRIGIGATFVHGYHNTGTPIFDLGFGNNDTTGSVVGTSFANTPGLATDIVFPITPIVTNSYGVEAAFRLTDNISISGFGAYTKAILIGQGTGDIWTYGAGVAISDFGKEGNVLGLFAGVEPTLRGLSNNVRPDGGFDRDNAYHVEGFYKFQVSDNISVTPGVIWVTAPGQNEDNDDVLIGTLRTTFSF